MEQDTTFLFHNKPFSIFSTFVAFAIYLGKRSLKGCHLKDGVISANLNFLGIACVYETFLVLSANITHLSLKIFDDKKYCILSGISQYQDLRIEPAKAITPSDLISSKYTPWLVFHHQGKIQCVQVVTILRSAHVVGNSNADNCQHGHCTDHAVLFPSNSTQQP
jgi:hypothetical protein